MVESKEILLSIVFLDVSHHYLASITLDSIVKQTKKDYELIIVTQNILSKDLRQIKSFSKHFKLIEIKNENEDLSSIKNKVLEKAQGKYVHFLMPGEFYLSKYSLQYAFSRLENKEYPDLVCFSYLHRDFNLYPQIRHPSFLQSVLGGKRYPLASRDVFFLKESLKVIGGFDIRYKGLEGFDAITKIHLRDNAKILCCRRVLVDYEPQKAHPKKLIGYISNLLVIIYRQYGFFSLFKWIVLTEIIDLIKFWFKRLKYYFQAE